MGLAAAHNANTRPDATLVAVGGAQLPEVCEVLRARGLPCDAHASLGALERAARDGAIVAYYCDRDANDVAGLVQLAGAAQAAGSQLIVCVPRPAQVEKPSDRLSDRALERIAGASFLWSLGAVVCDDPDVWTEVIALCAWHGMPQGAAVALVAAPGSWMERVAATVVADLELAGRRQQLQLMPTRSAGPAQLVLIDAADDSAAAHRSATTATIVPVAVLPDAAHASPRALRGVRNAMLAAMCCGHAAERRRARAQAVPPAIDEVRFARARMALADRQAKLGDHETKVFLAAFGVAVTRQAIASTPSAALRIAKTIGYPVEMKRWGADAAPESKGAVVETGIVSAADVRRAFLAVMKAGEAEAAAVVRASVPVGRNARLRFLQLGQLGWSMVLDPGAGRAPEIVPIPLSPTDAEQLANLVTTTRAGEPALDRDGFADIMLRASHLAFQLGNEITELVLDRVVVASAPAASVVADAYILRAGAAFPR